MDTNSHENRSPFGTFFAKVCQFFTAVPGALKNHLNTEELVKITIAALSTGGGLFGILQAIVFHAGTIFPAPSDAAFAAAVLTLILESYRRLGHGQETSERPRGRRSAY